MTERDKKTFYMMEEEEKNRFEYAAYRASSSNPISKPRPHFSSFYYFCQKTRAGIRVLQPKYKKSEVLMHLGELWVKSSPKLREHFEAIARADKARYETVKIKLLRFRKILTHFKIYLLRTRM